LATSPEHLKVAPGFDPDHWPALSEEKWNREVHQFYRRTPFWE
jgi:hypothetical protein